MFSVHGVSFFLRLTYKHWILGCKQVSDSSTQNQSSTSADHQLESRKGQGGKKTSFPFPQKAVSLAGFGSDNS